MHWKITFPPYAGEEQGAERLIEAPHVHDALGRALDVLWPYGGAGTFTVRPLGGARCAIDDEDGEVLVLEARPV